MGTRQQAVAEGSQGMPGSRPQRNCFLTLHRLSAARPNQIIFAVAPGTYSPENSKKKDEEMNFPGER